jgi:hypothetical protein
LRTEQPARPEADGHRLAGTAAELVFSQRTVP